MCVTQSQQRTAPGSICGMVWPQMNYCNRDPSKRFGWVVRRPERDYRRVSCSVSRSLGIVPCIPTGFYKGGNSEPTRTADPTSRRPKVSERYILQAVERVREFAPGIYPFTVVSRARFPPQGDVFGRR